MKTIWKYGLGPGTSQHWMPIGAKILSVGLAQGQISLWALVDPTAEKEERTILTRGTGHETEDATMEGTTFIGTVIHPRVLGGQDLVVHVFEQLRR